MIHDREAIEEKIKLKKKKYIVAHVTYSQRNEIKIKHK